MLNYCDYRMKVKGTKRKNVEEFIKIMKADYNNPHHFWRVFEANATEIIIENGIYSVEISGYCAWSVYCCMLEGGGTYYNDALKDGNTGFSSALRESDRLELGIEIFSEEAGCEFMEHYIINNGVLEVNECIDWLHYYIDPDEYENIEQFNKEMGTNFTEEDIDEDYYVSVGGIEWVFTI